MRDALLGIVAELERLKRQGQRRIYLQDGTLARLAERAGVALDATPGADQGADPVVTEAVERPRQATARPTSRKRARTSAAQAAPAEAAQLPPPPEVALPEAAPQAQWDWLRQRVLEDPVCRAQVKPGKQVVFGVGAVDADLFFCGEAPGADEEVRGEPFVGPAGQLLTKIIETMGLSRTSVYIGNIMNWRPAMPTAHGNRPPTQEEMAYCLPFLKAQLAIVRPRVIVALGKTAVDGLLGPDPDRRMGKVRGHWQDFDGLPLMPTYHPSYLLRNQSLGVKRQVWEDMLSVLERLDLPVTDKQRGFFLPRG